MTPLFNHEITVRIENVLQEQMEQNGNAMDPHGRDVTAVDNRRSDDVASVSSYGQTVTRDRHVAERMYVYY